MHEGSCKSEDTDWKNEQRLRYLLIAKCINCQAPISKNGPCKHMTCTRCNAEFCWICRKNWRGHKNKGEYDIKWVLGCTDLDGDTANHWLMIMILQFLILPFYAIFVSAMKTGLALNKLCFEAIEDDREIVRPFIAMSTVGMNLLFLPVQALIFAVIFPILICTRLF